MQMQINQAAGMIMSAFSRLRLIRPMVNAVERPHRHRVFLLPGLLKHFKLSGKRIQAMAGHDLRLSQLVRCISCKISFPAQD